jgi:elongation factor G
MRAYVSLDIRNVALAGHAHAGKTSLASAMLFAAGATSRLLRVEEGNSTTDFDEEEVERRHSISTGLAHLEWNKKKINLLDTPGLSAFFEDTHLCLHAADAVLLAVDGATGVQVQTEQVFQLAGELNLPLIFVVTKLDHDRACYDRVVNEIHEKFGRHCVSIGSPEEVMEMVAEDDDSLMQEFFDLGTLPPDHLAAGLRKEIAERKIFPILGASISDDGQIKELLHFIVNYVPPPVERGHLEESGPPSAFVFKTLSDPFAGRLSYFKLMSGTLKSDGHMLNSRTHADERFAHLSCPFGRQLNEVSELHAGDIGVIAKLKDTLTGDSLADKSKPIAYPRPRLEEATMAYAICAKTRNDEDRLSAALHKILEEDPSLHFYRDPQTKEFLLAGHGQLHVEVIVSRLRKRYHVDVELKAPKIAYRETIRASADVQGRHKKQTGGHGQFGDCKLRIEPLPRGAQFQFVNDVHGGAIPKNYIPAIEKGVIEAAATGHLAGYPMVDFKVTVYDGSYHDVDSNELSFKMAARKAFRAAMEQAKPALLEPVMRVEVKTPVDFAGDLMGDFTSRRGRMNGMESVNGHQVLRALVPMAEMLSYQNDLTAMTQGRASFHMDFDHYDFVPDAQAQKLITAAAVHHNEDE